MGTATGFCIFGPTLTAVGPRGGFKRGIMSNGEDGFVCIFDCAGV